MFRKKPIEEEKENDILTEKDIERSLIMSLLALLLCIAMLAGTSFAWFSDTVGTGDKDSESKNVIVAGTLEVKLSMLNFETAEYEDLAELEDGVIPLDSEYLEPNKANTLYLKLENVGSLPADCYLSVSVPDEMCYLNTSEEPVSLTDNMMFKLTEFERAANDGGKYVGPEAELEACKKDNEAGFDFDPLIPIELDGNDGTEGAECCKYYALSFVIPEENANNINYVLDEDSKEEPPKIDIAIDMFVEEHVATEDEVTDAEPADVSAETGTEANEVVKSGANSAPTLAAAPAADAAVPATETEEAEEEEETDVAVLVSGELMFLTAAGEDYPDLYINARDPEDKTFYIVSKEGFVTLADMCKADDFDKETVFCLANDIKYGEKDKFKPIESFNATLDGGGHKISGIVCSAEEKPCGFFIKLEEGAKITNLNFRNCLFEVTEKKAETKEGEEPAQKTFDEDLKAQPSCGTLAAEICGKDVLIDNVNVIRCDIKCAHNAGGLIGKVTKQMPEIKDCWVSGVKITGECYCSGVVGTAYDKLYMHGCLSQANVLVCTSDDTESGYLLVPKTKTVEDEDGNETVEEYNEYYQCWGVFYIDNYGKTEAHYHGTPHNV